MVLERSNDASIAVVLLSPVLHSGPTTTARNVATAMAVLGCARFSIVNLHRSGSRDLTDLNRVGATERAWLLGRPMLQEALSTASAVLFAWGLGGLAGEARRLFREQVAWTTATALRAGHRDAFMLDGAPRHPSRWRQYLGPQHGRFADGATFEDRLALALKPCLLK